MTIKDSDYVDHLLASKSDRPDIQAIQRHVAWLRSVVAAQGVGVRCPDTTRLVIRRSNHPYRNALWLGAAKITVNTSNGVSVLEIEAPAFVRVLRHEVVHARSAPAPQTNAQANSR